MAAPEWRRVHGALALFEALAKDHGSLLGRLGPHGRPLRTFLRQVLVRGKDGGSFEGAPKLQRPDRGIGVED